MLKKTAKTRNVAVRFLLAFAQVASLSSIFLVGFFAQWFQCVECFTEDLDEMLMCLI